MFPLPTQFEEFEFPEAVDGAVGCRIGDLRGLAFQLALVLFGVAFLLMELM